MKPNLKARDWQGRVDEMSDVMKLVHLAMRKTQIDVEQVRGNLLKERQRIYEDELTLQAQRVGCGGRHGRLTSGPSLTTLNELSMRDAQSIVNTYNYDLSLAIEHIRQETPTANRHAYARRLETWETKRAEWKGPQIAEYTEGTARSLAQQDFYQYNDIGGIALLQPKEAVCPVCQGWVRRGEVPLREAQNNPPPYHVNCPHLWATRPGRVPRGECQTLWMGE